MKNTKIAAKKKLLIIVGAGASIDFDLPSVLDIDNLFESWATQHFQLCSSPQLNLYQYIRNQINTFYSQNQRSDKQTNFEEIIYTLFQLSSFLEDPNRTYPPNAFCNVNNLPEINFPTGSRTANGNDLRSLALDLIDSLLAEFRNRCLSITQDRQADLLLLRAFLENLSKDFEIGFVTLNYDNIIKQALPDLFTGFDHETGEFLKKDILRRQNWHFIYHLHGSVHFNMEHINELNDLHAIRWQEDLSGVFQQNSRGRCPQRTTEGIPFPKSAIIAGYGKTQQIQQYPFRIYHSLLDKLVDEADAFMFIGYGFGDTHVNDSFYGFKSDSRIRPTMVIDYANNSTDPLTFLSRPWTRNLLKTIPSCTRSTPPNVRELKDNNCFEETNDSNVPLAVWYNGFLNVCNHYQKIQDFYAQNGCL